MHTFSKRNESGIDHDTPSSFSIPRGRAHTFFSESISECNILLNNTRVLRLFHGLHEKMGLVCRFAIGAYVGARVYWHSTWQERTGQLAAGDVVPF